jgi:hypothetical protein
MKYFSLIALILLLSGCSPWNAQLNIFTYNKYILGDESSSTGSIYRATSDEQATKAYGNGNRAIVIQGNFPYKSPVTNSSNSVPITVPLIPGV